MIVFVTCLILICIIFFPTLIICIIVTSIPSIIIIRKWSKCIILWSISLLFWLLWSSISYIIILVRRWNSMAIWSYRLSIVSIILTCCISLIWIIRLLSRWTRWSHIRYLIINFFLLLLTWLKCSISVWCRENWLNITIVIYWSQ